MPDSRPLIGVTGPARRGGLAWRFTRLALERAGARAVLLRPGAPRVDLPLHGIVIGGGADVDARLYGLTEIGPGVDPVRDRFELDALDRADVEGLPILGICRGAQLMNVWLGGSLRDDPLPRRWRPRRLLLPLVDVMLVPDSVLARALGRPRVRVNSLHHQSVDRLGTNLVVSGRRRSGIVQAIEDPEHAFRVGVQWHPELLPHSPIQKRLFAGLTRAARERLGDPVPAHVAQAP